MPTASPRRLPFLLPGAVSTALLIGVLLLARSDQVGRGGSAGRPLLPPAERRRMASFTLPMPDGNAAYILAEQARGRVTLINYAATWCPPCRQETPALVRIYARYRERNFALVGVMLDTERPVESVRRFAREFAVPYPLALGADDPGIVFSMQAIPVTVLLDRQGRMAKPIPGPVNDPALAADIERLLAEPIQSGASVP